jgi:hypothetical protein
VGNVKVMKNVSASGSWFRVWGLGFGVWGLGYRVQGSGFGVQGSGCRVQGSGFRVETSEQFPRRRTGPSRRYSHGAPDVAAARESLCKGGIRL